MRECILIYTICVNIPVLLNVHITIYNVELLCHEPA